MEFPHRNLWPAHATKTHWLVWGKIDAFEGRKKVFTKEWNEQIERKLQ